MSLGGPLYSLGTFTNPSNFYSKIAKRAVDTKYPRFCTNEIRNFRSNAIDPVLISFSFYFKHAQENFQRNTTVV